MHFKNLPVLVSNEDKQNYRCEFCGGTVVPPFCSHLCFHQRKTKPNGLQSEKLKRSTRQKPVEPQISDVNEDVVVEPWTLDYTDSEENESCIYCNSSMPPSRLFKHESWHRENDLNVVKCLTDTKSSRLPKNSEGLCMYCGIMKPSNKLRVHENRDHGRQSLRKVCDICGIFTCPTYIREHMRTHDAEKSFECDVCHKTFFRRKALARHKLVHSDVARYVCSVCGKSFKVRFNMRVHMRSHEDVKPFPCSVCKKTFTTKQWRDSHLRTHGVLDNR
ncbi:zinc finger protein 12-like [Anthonomus grandis grandis]|uniref:zinc finger protein 12-like n=1 Tax=Anthonomus grandis grandis TaxID=2921223 RepID=UPI0021652C23|nr:zinc finger protein 12-like [Anthonomus grandis grandis]